MPIDTSASGNENLLNSIPINDTNLICELVLFECDLIWYQPQYSKQTSILLNWNQDMHFRSAMEATEFETIRIMWLMIIIYDS